MSIDEELLNRSIDDISSDSDVQSKVGTSEPKSLSKEIATTSKMFLSSSKSKLANTFGVYPTKQVVAEVSSKTPNDTTEVQSTNEESLTGLESKTGKSINTDKDLEKATEVASVRLTEAKQINHDSRFGESPFVPDNLVAERTVEEQPLTVQRTVETTQNVTPNDSLRQVIPDKLPKEDYEVLRKNFGSVVGLFNDCPTVSEAMAYLNKILGVDELAKRLKEIAGIVSKYDLLGILNCLARLQADLTTSQRKGLADTLIDNGSFNGFADFTSVGNKGAFSDKYDAIRRLGQNRSVTVDNSTGRPSNTLSNPAVSSKADEMLAQMVVSKDDVLSADTTSKAKNPSITDNLSSKVFDVEELKKISKDSGFTKYLLGEKDKLLRSLPGSSKKKK